MPSFGQASKIVILSAVFWGESGLLTCSRLDLKLLYGRFAQVNSTMVQVLGRRMHW